ncbi:WXG100 family type VII secretion target [Amycolatopsis sp. PS_44_ISF1]|uniref:WXG100 family type VII secretion target n=1 Tax=Amycolatopsis sp. PS_44_ISF1 TaxID=2974917 RepID=UPI0028DEC254|nr:WXG100 family type VII secretion target [Amycolatopsis sp. PS_44_ISF1]MDT8914365.1 WXG100 family type VII secretion target [Amycolatopsis sp. PS_44_ISF1]
MTETAHTNFAGYTHQQLYAMLQAGDPNSAQSAADQWNSTAIGLHEQAENLSKELSDFTGSWTGGAADQYQTMITDLAGGIRKVAQTAQGMQHMLEDAAEALVKAKTEMPPPVSVPDVAPADLALAVNPPLLPPDSSPATVLAAAQQRQQAITNVEAQQQAANAAGSAHAKAIVVMSQLATNYTAAEDSIPVSPNAATPPSPTPGGGASGGGAVTGNARPGSNLAVDPAVDTHPLPVDGSVPPVAPGPGATAAPSSPLFGDMFTAGLAAASAAAFGRFGSIMPKVPGWASGKDQEDKKDDPAAPASGGGAGTEGGVGGGIPIGGGDAPSLGGGGGGIPTGGGLSGPGDAPAAHSGLAGDGGASNVLSGLAGGAAGAAGAAAKSAMPMMPMMPMGGMGAGGDLGSGRRIPAWLVETENVWGQQAPVAPSVIGEEPEAY